SKLVDYYNYNDKEVKYTCKLIILKGRGLSMTMQLAEVARALNIEAKEEWEDISITSDCFDSRKIESGALFILLVDENDGHKYVEAAIKGGAVATLWQEDHYENIPDSIAVLPV